MAASSKTVKVVIYLRRLVAELWIPSADATRVAVDNKAARDNTYKPENHEKMKHVEQRHLFIRE